jgi:hypothetical protein
MVKVDTRPIGVTAAVLGELGFLRPKQGRVKAGDSSSAKRWFILLQPGEPAVAVCVGVERCGAEEGQQGWDGQCQGTGGAAGLYVLKVGFKLWEWGRAGC